MAAGTAASFQNLLLIGVSQKQAPPELRELFFQLEPQLPRLLAELRRCSRTRPWRSPPASAWSSWCPTETLERSSEDLLQLLSA